MWLFSTTAWNMYLNNMRICLWKPLQNRTVDHPYARNSAVRYIYYAFRLGSWLLIHTDFSVVVKFSGRWWYKCINLHCSPDPLKPMHLAWWRTNNSLSMMGICCKLYIWYRNGYEIGIVLSPYHTNISTWLVFPQIIWGFKHTMMLSNCNVI